jgi:hypothetical protein
MTKWRRLLVAPMTDRGTTTKTAAPAYSIGDRQGHDRCIASLSSIGPVEPTCGGEGRRSPRAPSLSIFLFLLFLFLSLSPVYLGPSLGL